MFSKLEQKAIEEKTAQLRKVQGKELTPKELELLITDRGVIWIKEHLGEMLAKYSDLSPEEQAYNIVFQMSRVSPTKIKIESYNFCPYLEACRILDLDTRFVCKEIGEPSIQKMIEVINPKLKFSRNYEKIRPHNRTFCEEYIEKID